ncbi:MAG: RNA polymerase sigma-70 factor (ECF subfamily) [Ilumatobacter sp.]
MFRRHGADLVRFAERRSGSSATADDVVAVAFERAWLALDELDDRGIAVRPWLFRVAANELIDVQRSDSRRVSRESRVASGEAALGAVAMESEADLGQVSLDELRDALGRLTTDHHEIIMLRYMADLSPVEVAVALDLEKSAAGVRTHRAMAALRTALATQLDTRTEASQ